MPASSDPRGLPEEDLDSSKSFGVLGLCFVLTFMSRSVADTYTVMLRPLEAEFGASRAQLTAVYSLVMLVGGLGAPVAGWLFQRFGARLLYATGFAFLSVAAFRACRAEEVGDLVWGLGFFGGFAAAGLGMVPAATMLTWWFKRRASFAIGVAYAGLGFGSLVLVPAAQALVDHVGWRDAYFLLGSGAAVAGILVQMAPWRAIAKRQPLATSNPREAAQQGFRSAIRQRRFWLLVQVVFFTSLGMYVVLVQSVVYLTDVGFTPAQSAAAYGAAGMLSVSGVIGSGWLAERMGHRRAATFTFAGSAVGLLLLLLLAAAPSVWLLATYVVLFGVCQGTRGPLVSGLSAAFFKGPGYASVYGTILAFLSVGSALGAFASGWLHDLTGGYVAGFAFALGCLGLAAIPFWWNAQALMPVAASPTAAGTSSPPRE